MPSETPPAEPSIVGTAAPTPFGKGTLRTTLLVLALLVTPAAAAMRVTASALWVPVLSVTFGVASVVGGILLALGGSLPISPYVTTISFLIYVVCRITGNRRLRRGWASRGIPSHSAADVQRREASVV